MMAARGCGCGGDPFFERPRAPLVSSGREAHVVRPSVVVVVVAVVVLLTERQ